MVLIGLFPVGLLISLVSNSCGGILGSEVLGVSQ
jgi:hypothetical protein